MPTIPKHGGEITPSWLTDVLRSHSHIRHDGYAFARDFDQAITHCQNLFEPLLAGDQFTGQQLGSSLGVALIGAIVLTGLANTFVSTIQADPRISEAVAGQVGTQVGSGIDFVSSAGIETAAQKAGLDAPTTAAIVEDYEQAQLRSLKAGLLAAAILALVSLAFTGGLPGTVPMASGAAEDAATATDEVASTAA